MRHIVNLSGGKDSTALAIYLKNSMPNDYEYVFCDTGCELPETYEYLVKIEDKLNIKITRLNTWKTFDYYLEKMNGYLPSASARWCTREMKIRPWEMYIGNDEVCSYIAIRADENRKGYISSKKNIVSVYPFIEKNIDIDGVNKILIESGIGYPEYYKWRTRSGCYFCMFQRRVEWVNLYKNHPDLFKKALNYEKNNYTWINGMSLLDLIYNGKEIEERYNKKHMCEEVSANACTICSI